MNSEIKKIWVDALLSGEYSQGISYLNRNDRFCCLGVLCDIYDKSIDKISSPADGIGVVSYGDECSLMPSIVAEWAGLPDDGMCAIDKKLSNNSSLAYLNDAGLTFENIAKIIEEKL